MEKSPDAFRTISEVADWLGVPTHVLRFWESRFAQVKPVKRAGGRRYYRPSDMELLGGIKRLLHDDGMTIRGVQKLLRDKGARHVAGLSQPLFPDVEDAEIVDDTAVEATQDDGVVDFPVPEPEPEPEIAVVPETEMAVPFAEPEVAEMPETADDEVAPDPEPVADVQSDEHEEAAQPEAAEDEVVPPVDAGTAAEPTETPGHDGDAPSDLIDLMAAEEVSAAVGTPSIEPDAEPAAVSPDPLVAPDVPEEDPSDEPGPDDTRIAAAVRLRLTAPTSPQDIVPVFQRLRALRDRLDSRDGG